MMEIIETGKTYRFNNAVAVVVDLTDDEVVWRVHDMKRAFKHCVPRWYFEKYASPVQPGNKS